MSIRNAIALSCAVSALLFLFGCGSSSTPKGVAPPSGGFTNSNLNGTYVFSVSGFDTNQAPFAIVGTLIANGSGGITGGALDIVDFTLTATVPNSPVGSNSSYSVGPDGRGTAILKTSTPFGTITLGFVLTTSAHGLVTEADVNASGSGTLDLQTSTTLAGPYAFSFAGLTSSPTTFATVGTFTLGLGGSVTGAEDFNVGGFPTSNQSIGGTVVLGPSSTPATTLGGITYDVFAIDATHLKFIEMDFGSTMSGDAFAQTGTTVPTGALSFTLGGTFSGGAAAAGGFMVTDGAGNITTASTEDANNNGTGTGTPLGFSGSYTNSLSVDPGRYTITFANTFFGGTTYAAYPFGGGLLLLEIDTGLGTLNGSALTQSSTSFANDGYGLNFSGINLGAGVEVDDIAEFVANSSGATITGFDDENFAPGSAPLFAQALSGGSFTAPDANGRGSIAANVNNVNGGFAMTFYSVDGVTFPFIENDGSGQVALGTFELQNSSSSAPAARPGLFITHPAVRPHAAKQQKKSLSH